MSSAPINAACLIQKHALDPSFVDNMKRIRLAGSLDTYVAGADVRSLYGVDERLERILKSRMFGIRTVGDFVNYNGSFINHPLSPLTPREARKLETLRARLQSCNLPAKPTVDSPNSRPANVIGVAMNNGFGALGLSMQITYRARNTANELAFEVVRGTRSLRVRIAEYADPMLVGGAAMVTKTATIPLAAVIPAGTTVSVVNKDGKTVFTKTFSTSNI